MTSNLQFTAARSLMTLFSPRRRSPPRRPPCPSFSAEALPIDLQCGPDSKSSTVVWKRTDMRLGQRLDTGLHGQDGNVLGILPTALSQPIRLLSLVRQYD